ncbi:PLP-dependent aminotransferase family protein [Roseibium aestuarii]|uniref:PLP-dependent aminotransferase family protein n=1 Tax=Roseibium aestuarii TaxID=2600299 RepID=A0ABW4K138_9HYPH|nr:PLP-dependent aminotransferase family protein [Roseibium aestuarii]
MTNSPFSIPDGNTPIYMRLADQIADSILSGTLAAGTRLPPQRNLAFDLGVTVGTVGRAYALVREQGLVSGEVGRGTYVLGSQDRTPPEAGITGPRKLRDMPRDHPLDGLEREDRKWSAAPRSADTAEFGYGSTRLPLPPHGAIRLDSTSAPELGQGGVMERILPQIALDAPYEIASYTRILPDSWREAGVRWLSRGGWTPTPDVMIPTFGAQAAIMAVINSMTAPGDRIVFEELTYSSVARAARFSGRQVVQVRADAQGPLPDHLDSVCRQTHPRLIFLMPSMHNPTLGVLSAARRAELLEVARRHDLWIIEDEVYGALIDTGLEPLASLAPERTFHVGSLSKAVAAGIRGGWVASPPAHVQRLITAHKMMTGGSSYLLCEAAARLVNSGEADRIRDRVKAEIAARQAMAVDRLGNVEMETSPEAPFLWLKLPDPWLPGTFKAAAAARNVLIDDEDEFRTGRARESQFRVRVALTNPQSREELAAGLDVLRQLLADDGACCYDSFE